MVVNPAVPRDLSIICMKALERNPADRYATLADFADDVERWTEGRSITARPASRLEVTWRWARRHPLSAGLIAALVAVTFAGAVLLTVSHHERGAALHRSLIGEAHSERMLGKPGHRQRAMQNLRQAAELAVSPDIRNEAAALLARPDFSPAGVTPRTGVPVWPPDRVADDPVKVRHVSRSGSHDLTIHALGTARLWRRDETEPLKEWEPPPGSRIAVDFSPDGNALIVAGTVQGVVEENLTNPSGARVLAPPGPLVSFLTIDPAGRRLALARVDGLEVMDLRGTSKAWHFGDSPARCAASWSADGSRIAAALGDRREVTILAAESGAVCTTAAMTGMPRHINFHPDGSLLAVAVDDGTVAICEAASGVTWTVLHTPAESLEFSTDGSELRATDPDGLVRTWSVSMPVAFQQWSEPARSKEDGAISGMAHSPGGSHLLTVASGCLAVWSLAERRQTGLQLLETQRIDADASAWWLSDTAILLQVPGGLERLTIGADGTIESHERLPKVPGSKVLGVQSDGGWIVSLKDEDGGTSCEVWPGGNPAQARPATVPGGVEKSVAAVHAASGQSAALTDDGAIEWRRADTTLTRLMPPLNPGVRALSFSQDGRQLIILTRQHRVFSWDLSELSEKLDELGL